MERNPLDDIDYAIIGNMGFVLMPGGSIKILLLQGSTAIYKKHRPAPETRRKGANAQKDNNISVQKRSVRSAS